MVDIWSTICLVFKYIAKYSKYLYYGFKQRIVALFKGELGIFKFFLSLFKLPFEAWSFSKMEMKYV